MRTLAAVLTALLSPALLAVPVCDYDVSVSGALVLDVHVECDAGVEDLSAIGAPLRGFATEVHREHSERGFSGGYRVDLAAMAGREQSVDSALAVGDSILTVGAAWLMRPSRASRAPGELRVRVRSAPGVAFAAGQPIVDGVFRVPEGELARAGFSAFGRLRAHTLTARGDGASEAGYRVIVLDGPLDVGDPALLRWVGEMVAGPTEFWGRFPAEDMSIFVVPRAARSGVPFGRAMAGGGVSMVLYVGEHATSQELREDWVLIHEMVHVGSPFVFRGPWFSEGLATYLEPLIRARAGLQTVEAMWSEFMTYMPRGAAVIGATGLARAGRRGWYWGGALLMLLADVEMRRASGGRAGLEDCLRRILRDVGNYRQTIGVEGMVSACDSAVGGQVLSDLVRRHVFAAESVALERLWRDLGLALRDGELTVSDEAPLAALRKALERGGGE